jgi:Ca2+-transporting ATPase
VRSIDQVAGPAGIFPGLDLEHGLTAAQVRESSDRLGANTLTPLPREPVWRKFLAKFDEPIIRILLAAALLSTVVDLFKASALYGLAGMAVSAFALGPPLLFARLRPWFASLMLLAATSLCAMSFLGEHPSYEGVAVMVAVVLATGVAFASEHKSDREFEALNAARGRIRAKVRRAGIFQTIRMDDVVVGDIVLLEAGDEVPADGRLVSASELSLDQSLITGESLPVRKATGKAPDSSSGPEHTACVFRGTQVVAGVGAMLVCESGDSTMVGKIATALGSVDAEELVDGNSREGRVRNRLTVSKAPTPLQSRLKELADTITWAGYAAAFLIFCAMLAKEWAGGSFRDPLSATGALLGAVVYAVIIVVVAVPEGLPMSVTVSLALAMRKMTRANSLVRQLVACETIGSATVICSDKTGTMTKNRMAVTRIGYGELLIEKGGAGWPEMMIQAAQVRGETAPGWVGLNSAVNSTAVLEKREGRVVVVGNGTEGALLHWLGEAGVDYLALRSDIPALYQGHFTSDRKCMTSVVRLGGGGGVILVKGASEVVLPMCDRLLDSSGLARPLYPSDRERIAGLIASAAGDSMRTLAFAHRPLDSSQPSDPDTLHARRGELEQRMIFDGFVAISDPLREDVAGAIALCRDAGISVMMVTGDNPETAKAIGREAGLIDSNRPMVITSAEFQAMSETTAREEVARVAILARARPLDKLRLVRLLQERGEVVAVTGDGTNDAPALKRADVGLAMGIAGTEVAKEASKIILLDDSFATIVKAVHWGRALHENIQRFIQFQLTINLSALVIAFAAPFMGLRPPFTVLQLLWINVIMDTLASIALCSEPPRPGLMREKPKGRKGGIVTSAMWRSIAVTAAFYVFVLLGLLWLMKGAPDHPGWLGESGTGTIWLVEGPGGHVDRLPADEISPAGEAFLTLRQATILFTAYVMFQVWNMFNCRSLSGGASAFANLAGNPNLLFVAAAIVGFQVVIVTFLGPIFQTVPLGIVDWVVIIAATSSVLVLGEFFRMLARRREAALERW